MAVAERTLWRDVLNKVLEAAPDDAYDIMIELPNSVEGKPRHEKSSFYTINGQEIELYRGDGRNHDVVRLGWYTGWDHHQERGGARLYVSPNEFPNEQLRAIYDAVRRQGVPIYSATDATKRAEALTPAEREIYLQLLKDGTTWPQAILLTETLLENSQ